MKKGIISFVTAVFTAASATAAVMPFVKAGSVFSDIRSHILLSGKYDSTLDTNGNGRVDVLDLCREKSKLLSPETAPPEEENYSFLSFGTPEADYESGTLVIPLELAKTYIDLKKVTFELDWDTEAFQVTDLYQGDMAGMLNIRYSSESFSGEWEFTDNAMNGGTLMYLEFGIMTPLDGDYTFSLYDVTGEAVKDGKTYTLSGDECPQKSMPLTLSMDSDTVFVPPPVTEEPPYQGPDVPSVDADAVYSAMTALKEKYPEGMRWTNDNYYGWNGGIFTGGYGCAGFAFMLSDAAFGRLPARKVADMASYRIRTGDILRMDNDSHSVIVLQVLSDGVIVAEGNYNSSVHWGRKIPSSALKNLTYIMTRYPD